jgi:predicted nicotinamide N-methyase
MTTLRTHYDGPERVEALGFGGFRVQVARPDDPERLLEADDVLDLNRRDDYMPYWAFLWPGAYLLAQAVADEPWEPGTQAIEIGCGLGLAGLVAAAAGLQVHFTDYDQAPLDFVARSARATGLADGSWTTGTLDWRQLPVDHRYPVILGADVLYERRLVPLVSNLIATLLAPAGVALVAGPYRVATEDLPAELARLGLSAEARPIEARDLRGEVVRGVVHRITRTPVD